MSDSDGHLESLFYERLLQIYEEAKRLKQPYNCVWFLRMLHEYGGKEIADRILFGPKPSHGFRKLLGRGKKNIRLTVEYVVLQDPWRKLFSKDQLDVARKRLRDHHCDLPQEEESPDS